MRKKIIIKTIDNYAKDYPITFVNDLFAVNTWLPKFKFSQIVMITDENVYRHFGLILQKKLIQAGYQTLLLVHGAGEKYKTYANKQKLENAMQAKYCDRDTLLLALGGGVVGDLAGFIAATFLRGIAYLQLPTSLLAMVDSSVGGKVAINTKFGKNLIGSFYQPKKVVIDINLLNSLPQKHFINGLIEVIKMFLTHDKQSLQFLENNLDAILKRDNQLLKEIIYRAICIKAQVVSQDIKEKGERRLLNFGHTIGHALEKLSCYRLLHGYAVGYGILIEACISNLLYLLSDAELQIIKNLLAKLNLHGKDIKKFPIKELIFATKFDKKSRLGKVYYVLLKSLGKTYKTKKNIVHVIDDSLVTRAYKMMVK